MQRQGIQSHASMDGQGVFAQAVGNQTRIIVFYAGGNSVVKCDVGLVHRAIGLLKNKDIPLERDSRPLKKARYTIICVNDWRWQI